MISLKPVPPQTASSECPGRWNTGAVPPVRANPETPRGELEQREKDDQAATNSEAKVAESTSWDLPGFKSLFSSALVRGIRSIADESDRKEISAWFIQSRQILEPDKPKKCE